MSPKVSLPCKVLLTNNADPVVVGGTGGERLGRNQTVIPRHVSFVIDVGKSRSGGCGRRRAIVTLPAPVLLTI
jgi:hypothetical protein